MIPNTKILVNKNKGSSLSLPAHGWVGARATLLFLAAHFAKQNTNSVGVQSEGEAEGGCGGNSASPEPKRSPAALLAKSRIQQKSFLFLLPARRSLGAGGEEKIGCAQIKKCRENFFAGWRASASVGGAERQFRSKKFRAKFRISHQSQLSPFWERITSRLRRSAFGLCALRKAIKSHGGQKEKEMDLSFSYLK